MEQDYNGFLRCVEGVPFADELSKPLDQPRTFEGCMVKSGYDPNAMTYDGALALAHSQQDYALRHPKLTTSDYLGGAAFFAIPLSFVLIVGFSIRNLFRRNHQWEQLPTLDLYLKAHPDCRTGAGIKCAACGSKSIKNWGVSAANDRRRSFICNSCGETLYRLAG